MTPPSMGLHPWWPAELVPWLHPHLAFEVLGWLAGTVLVVAMHRRDPAPLEAWDRIVVSSAAILGALAGAKLLFWLTDPFTLLAALPEPSVLIGGKTIVGGLLGAQIGVEIAKRVQGVHRSTGDAYVYPLLVGLVLGRLGCFFSGTTDGTHGLPTRLPWAMDLGDGVLRHPTALYEIAFLLVLGAALTAYGRRGRSGDRFAGFMVGYLVFRLFAEAVKVQPVWPFGLSSIQVACALGLLGYSLALPRRLRRGATEGERDVPAVPRRQGPAR